MRKGIEYLLQLDSTPTTQPKEGSQAIIFDWEGHESFPVIVILTTEATDDITVVHVRAITDNAYAANNLQNSRLRYQQANGDAESREIVSIRELGKLN